MPGDSEKRCAMCGKTFWTWKPACKYCSECKSSIIKTKRQYILEAVTGLNEFESAGYYTGKSYIHQCNRYAVVDRDISEAKVYTSESKAKKANEMCFENYTFQLVPLDN